MGGMQVPALYKIIAEQLLSEFQSRNWRDGAVLPSESRLPEAFGASRTTERRLPASRYSVA